MTLKKKTLVKQIAEIEHKEHFATQEKKNKNTVKIRMSKIEMVTEERVHLLLAKDSEKD